MLKSKIANRGGEEEEGGREEERERERERWHTRRGEIGVYREEKLKERRVPNRQEDKWTG